MDDRKTRKSVIPDISTTSSTAQEIDKKSTTISMERENQESDVIAELITITNTNVDNIFTPMTTAAVISIPPATTEMDAVRVVSDITSSEERNETSMNDQITVEPIQTNNIEYQSNEHNDVVANTSSIRKMQIDNTHDISNIIILNNVNGHTVASNITNNSNQNNDIIIGPDYKDQVNNICSSRNSTNNNYPESGGDTKFSPMTAKSLAVPAITIPATTDMAAMGVVSPVEPITDERIQSSGGRVLNFGSMFLETKSFRGIGLERWLIHPFVDDLSYMFKGATLFYGNLSGWDVSGVYDMNGTFADAQNFDGIGLENWNRSQLINTISMLTGALSFTGNLSG